LKKSPIHTFLQLASARAEDLPYFYLPAHADFLKKEQEKDCFVAYDDAFNSVVLTVWKIKFLRVARLLYGPLDRHGKRLDPARESEFLERLVAFVEKNDLADRIVQPENFAIFQSPPPGSISARFGTYYLDLIAHDEEALFSKLHGKHRNAIRNAENKGVCIRFGPETLEDFYRLYIETTSRSGLYCEPYSYFTEMHRALQQNVLCGIAMHEDKPLGGLFMPYTRFGAFYLHGASAEKQSVNGAMSLLHWEAIRWLKAQQVRRYDFVGARLSNITGTRLEGIQQFKKRFGAELETGYLWKTDINRSKCTIFDLALNAKMKLKRSAKPLDIIDQELQKQ